MNDIIVKILKVTVRLLKLVTFTLLLLTPIMVVLISFNSSLYSIFPAESYSFRWFANFFSAPGYLSALQSSFLIAVIVVSLSLVIGTLASYAMVRYNFRAKHIIDILTQAPLAFPGVVLGNALLIYFVSISFNYTPIMLILGHIIVALPFVFRAMIPCFYGINQSFEEASMTLGANRIQTFTRITLPLAKPGLVAAALLTFVVSFNEYSVSIFLVSAKTLTLPVLLMGAMKNGFDPTIAAASTFTTILMLILMLAVEKLVGLDKLITAMK